MAAGARNYGWDSQYRERGRKGYELIERLIGKFCMQKLRLDLSFLEMSEWCRAIVWLAALCFVCFLFVCLSDCCFPRLFNAFVWSSTMNPYNPHSNYCWCQTDPWRSSLWADYKPRDSIFISNNLVTLWRYFVKRCPDNDHTRNTFLFVCILGCVFWGKSKSGFLIRIIIFRFFWANPKIDLEYERSKLKKDFLD